MVVKLRTVKHSINPETGIRTESSLIIRLLWYAYLRVSLDSPTLELASVRLFRLMTPCNEIESGHLFKVVDFPEEGLPTSPMRGSRVIWNAVSAQASKPRCALGRATDLLNTIGARTTILEYFGRSSGRRPWIGWIL